MKLCKTCGAPMDGEATFCPMCGADNTNKVNNSCDNNGNEETTMLNPDDIKYVQNFQNSNSFQNSQSKISNKKKLSKGAIIAIIAAVIVIIAGVSITAIAFNNSHHSADSIDDMELPEMPDLDINTDDLLTDDELGISGTSDVFGTSKNGVYINEFADIKFHTPSREWKLMTNDEIYNYYTENGANLTYDETTGKTYYSDSSGKVYYDMFMHNTETNQNIQVMITECADGVSDTLGNYFGYIEEGLKETNSSISLKSAGIATIGSNTYSVKSAHYTVLDNEIVQYYVGCTVENCFVIICISSNAEADEGFISTLSSIIACK